MHEQDRHRGREREREAQRKRYIPIATVTNDNQPSLKVTKSLYIVTILGQLPFMLFTEIAQTWVVQKDSVNTAIIHSYSTLSTWPFNFILVLDYMSYLSPLSLLPFFHVSHTPSLTFSSLALTSLLSLPFCSMSTLYPFTLVHLHFSHSACHITTTNRRVYCFTHIVNIIVCFPK